MVALLFLGMLSSRQRYWYGFGRINHEADFQLAFEKKGRIDVDPDCKWLIQTAVVDTAVRELTADYTDSISKGKGVFAEASIARKVQVHTKLFHPGVFTGEPEKETARKLEGHIAAVVSKALMVKVHLDPFANFAVPEFAKILAYLDESRLGALRAKSQERVLLANLLARKTMISESFSHAYVSAMVRAGEALGHGKLFEFAQNEYALVSTMIPYDIFTDETGAWEEPCKTDGWCFPSCLCGDDLLKRAHARAMFHKSLRKLQDRHTIRGGVPDNGPYPDSSERDQKGGQGADVVAASAPSRPNLKRRYSSIAEPPPPPGTGSAKATSWAVYDPKHTSEPLDWQSHHLENKPYGRHRRGERHRSLSVSLEFWSQWRAERKERQEIHEHVLITVQDNIPHGGR